MIFSKGKKKKKVLEMTPFREMKKATAIPPNWHLGFPLIFYICWSWSKIRTGLKARVENSTAAENVFGL